MLRFAIAVVAVLALAACDSAPSTSEPIVAVTTTVAATSSTTTTIVDDNCELVATDTVSFLESLIRVLDDTHLAEFRDRGDWSEDLTDLQQASRDLDIRAEVLECDSAAIQQRALDEADLAPGSPLSEGLLDVLLAPPTTTTTTTTTTTLASVVDSTTADSTTPSTSTTP